MDTLGMVTPISQSAVVAAADGLAKQGLRVIAIAISEASHKVTAPFTEQAISTSLVLVGLQGMHVPHGADWARLLAAHNHCGYGDVSRYRH
ncbi:MAG TPA: hypothetical protein VGP24_14205 [Glaciihabitans sp.]|nr:hypothetical protein [Glaciihabitans sp.]